MAGSTFKRGAKLTLKVDPSLGSGLRSMLIGAIKPMVDYLASELAELALARLRTDLERIGDAFEVAVSAFASEVANANPDTRDHDPVPQVRRSAGRGLQGNGERSARADQDIGREPPTRPASAPSPRRGEGEHPARLVRPRDVLEQHLGPEIATMLDAPQRQANGKRLPACSKCGFSPGNARGCGTSHKPQRQPDGDL